MKEYSERISRSIDEFLDAKQITKRKISHQSSHVMKNAFIKDESNKYLLSKICFRNKVKEETVLKILGA